MRVKSLCFMSPTATAVGCLLGGLILLSGCPLSSQTATSTSGSPSSVEPCGRNLDGDVKTARDRLSRGHPEEALVYIDSLKSCDFNQGSLEFLELASAVYEVLGDLNQAWWALHTAHRLEGKSLDDEQRVTAHRAAFEDSYARLVTLGKNSSPVNIDYLGAVLDEATYQLLKKVSANDGVPLGSGQWGFWLFPGRYEIMGKSHTLLAGQTLDLHEGSVR